MTAPTSPPPVPARSDGRGRRPRPARLMASRMWDNRPTLGTTAGGLAVPGAANVLMGWPLWQVAAGLWSTWLLLMVAVSLSEVRRATTPPGHGLAPGERGAPPGTGEEVDR